LNFDVVAPKTVTSIADIKVVASVTNTGSEDVKIIKYGNILDANTPTASFEVSKGDQVASFVGIKVSRPLPYSSAK
jgi:deuterolysin